MFCSSKRIFLELDSNLSNYGLPTGFLVKVSTRCRPLVILGFNCECMRCTCCAHRVSRTEVTMRCHHHCFTSHSLESKCLCSLFEVDKQKAFYGQLFRVRSSDSFDADFLHKLPLHCRVCRLRDFWIKAYHKLNAHYKLNLQLPDQTGNPSK